MKKRLKKSQALIEMAIFGTIILAILGSLLSYLQKMNEQQYVKQEAFRRALAKSDEVQSSVNYTVMADKRNTSVNSPLLGDRASYSGSATVLWGITPEGKEDLGGSYYMVNKDELKLDKDDENGDGGDEDADAEPEEDRWDEAKRMFINEVVRYNLRNHPNGPVRDMATRILTEKLIEAFLGEPVEESVDDVVRSGPGIEGINTKVESNIVNNKSVYHVPNQVNSYHKGELDEGLTYTFKYSDGTERVLTQYIGEDGKYSEDNSSDGKYTKERRWISSYE